MGLEGAIGTHPGEGLWVRLPLALLPLFMVARSLKEGGLVRLGAGCLTLGYWLVLAGAWPMNGQSGRILVPPRAVQTIEVKDSASREGVDFAIAQRPIWTESFQAQTAGREISVHAKMQFRAEITDSSVVLVHGQPKDEESDRGRVEFSFEDGVEKPVGPWHMFLDGLEDGPFFDTARLTLKPRYETGSERTVDLGLGATETLPDGTSLRLDKVSYRDPSLRVLQSR